MVAQKEDKKRKGVKGAYRRRGVVTPLREEGTPR